MGRFLAVAVALAGFLVAGWFLDAPDERPREWSVDSFSVTPARLPIGCPGRLVLPVGDDGAADGFFSSGSDDARYSLLISTAEPAIEIGGGWASTEPSGAEVERVGDGDLAGLAAVACTTPREDSWIVGGSTALGDSARLVLTNPAVTPSEVRVTVFGPAGPVEQPLAISVAGESQETVLLEGLASGITTTVVRVEATGAGVSAVVQDSRLDGFHPAGTDWAVPGSPPAERIVVAGVGPSNPAGEAGPAQVRLMAPNGATVRLTLVDSGGEVTWPGVSAIRLEAGVVLDVDVPEVGLATVLVEADAPVVAGARSSTARQPEEGLDGDLEREFLWVAGQQPHGGSPHLVTMPYYTTSFVVYTDESEIFRAFDAATGTLLVERVLAPRTTTEVPISVPPVTVVEVAGDAMWVLRIADDPGFVAALHPADVGEYPVDVAVNPEIYVP